MGSVGGLYGLLFYLRLLSCTCYIKPSYLIEATKVN